MEKGFLGGPIDLSFWNAHGQEFDVNRKKDYPLDQWEMIRTDLYVQGCANQISRVLSAIYGTVRM